MSDLLELEKPQPSVCFICKRGGSNRKWQLCESNHYQFLCFDCASTLDQRRECVVRDCSAKTLHTQIREVAFTYLKWMKNLRNSMSLLEKYEGITSALRELHEDTRSSFQQAVEKTLKPRPGISRRALFQNYLQKLTKYIISVRVAGCREWLTHVIQQDDRANTQFQNRLNNFSLSTEDVARAPRGMGTKESTKLQKYPINCLICFNNFNVIYKWTYCENDHLHNTICRECLYKVKECPVCRGKLRTPVIKACQESMLEWDTTFNQHLSISDMINLLMKDTLSPSSRGIIHSRLLRENARIKPLEFGDYNKLVELLSAQWCFETDNEKHERIFKMIEAYEQEYELIINLKKIIQDKLNEYSKRYDKKADSDSEESSDSVEESGERRRRRWGRSPSPRARPRDHESISSESESSVSVRRLQRSRSRSRDNIFRRDPRINLRSPSRSRSRSRSRERAMAPRRNNIPPPHFRPNVFGMPPQYMMPRGAYDGRGFYY